MTEAKRPLKVFLCHASQDKPAVRELYNALKAEGWIDPWLDKAKILPGQDWRTVIEKAVEESDVVIVCLSTQSVSKEGFVQREIKYAYDIALEKPEETIFLIPLRLDDCAVPRGLRSFHWVNYFDAEKSDAYLDLLNALKFRHEQKLRLEEMERVRREKEEQERVAAEKAKREKTEREAAEWATKERVERIAAENAKREEAERRVAEKVARDKVRRQAAEIAKRERLERRADRTLTVTKILSESFTSLKSTILSAIPILRIAGFAGVAVVLFWAGSQTISGFFSPAPTETTPLPSLTYISPMPTFTQSLPDATSFSLTPTPMHTAEPLETVTIPVRASTAIPAINVEISSDNISTIKLLAQWPKGQIADLAWYPNSTNLAMAGSTGIYIEDVMNLANVKFLETSSPAQCVTFSSDGKLVAGGDRDGSIYLWNFEDGKLVYKLEKKQDQGVNDVIFSPDGLTLISVGNDFKINIWNITNGSLKDSWSGFVGWIDSVAFLPNGEAVTTLHANGQIRHWRVSDGSILSVAFEKNPLGIFSEDRTLLALGFQDGNVKILLNQGLSVLSNMPQKPRPVTGLAISPNSTLLVVAYGYNSTDFSARNIEIHFFNITDGRRLFESTDLISPVNNIAFSEDQTLIASSTVDGVVQIWGIFP